MYGEEDSSPATGQKQPSSLVNGVSIRDFIGLKRCFPLPKILSLTLTIPILCKIHEHEVQCKKINKDFPIF